MRPIAIAGTLCLLLTSTALAQTPQQSKAQSTPNAPIQQQVKQDLSQEGFTNVQVMPESFLVRATDKSGNRIMMILNPDSVTAVTAYEPQKNGQDNTAASSKGVKNNATTSQ